MTHIWVRAESRDHEERVGMTPDGAAELLAAGYTVTVEESVQRAIPIVGYRAAGCAIRRRHAPAPSPHHVRPRF